MDFLKHWLLTILIFLPMAGAAIVLFMRTRDGVRWAALGTTLLTFLLSLLLLATYKWDGKLNGYNYEENGGVCRWCSTRDGFPPSTSNIASASTASRCRW